MAEQDQKRSEPLEIESLTPDDLSTEDLEDASGGTTCADYTACKGFSSPQLQEPGGS